MITPSAQKIKDAVETRFNVPRTFVYNRRYIAGTTIWSQHAWGNANDFMVYSDRALGDRIYAYLIAERRKGTLPIGTILWRVKGHFDHLHVEGKPKKTGTPPPTSSATTGDNEMRLPLSLGDKGEDVGDLQIRLNECGFDPGPLDNVYGPKTSAAILKMRKSVGSSATHGNIYNKWAKASLDQIFTKKFGGGNDGLSTAGVSALIKEHANNPDAHHE